MILKRLFVLVSSGLDLNMAPVFAGADAVDLHLAYPELLGQHLNAGLAVRVLQPFLDVNDLRTGQFQSFAEAPFHRSGLNDVRAFVVVRQHFFARRPSQVADFVIVTRMV